MNTCQRRNCVGAAVCAVIVCTGCDSQQSTSSKSSVQEPLPIGTTQTAHEDDVVAPLYSHDDAMKSTSSSARTLVSQAKTAKTPPEQDTQEASPTKQQEARPERVTEADETETQAESTDPERRTSMPQRRGSAKGVVKGGVRKALPVAQAASPLFGKWTVDAERSSKGFVDGDSILFLADGRMRIWKDGTPEDGRWTWDSSEGIKTGGVNGVPFTLGAFDQEAGDVIITRNVDGETQTLVLQPDRLFVAPPPVTTGTPQGPSTASKR